MKTNADNRNVIQVFIASAIQWIKRFVRLDQSNISPQITLTAKDLQALFDLEDHPPEPTERMKKALQTYKKIVAEKI
ncbi:hypothetical protein ACQE3E_15980 [Methylomonas sp. MED-D]|uniref:Uncharacterized protein n=1 Tax=Methylomonas koyamae TaxID=702114 RepID=A0A177PCX8_9GAMM|nr:MULTISPECIES: hypothetical protein [Methylomonas]MDT4331144.1 hypothetical protein [Methylomonas sp. MV1]OAI27674.1 hypothetical protein A1355_18080 [Methylomonas koyamae]